MRHGSVGGLVGVIAIIKVHGFCVSLKPFNNAVGVFGIIFCHPCFYAGGIKDCHIGFGRVDGLADRLGKVNEAIEDGLDIFQEILLEMGDLRGIGHFVKTAEFTEMA